jgi:DNA-binding NarL/FixJ family response regulator
MRRQRLGWHHDNEVSFPTPFVGQRSRDANRTEAVFWSPASIYDVTVIRVFAVDDHPLIREGIAALIGGQKDMQLAGHASSAAEAIQKYRSILPDVTLMDLRLPDMNGIDALIAIRSEFRDARVLMLTTFEGDAEIQGALQAGARGYMLKGAAPAELIDAIRDVHAGKKRIPAAIAAQLAEHAHEEPLTLRELEVLQRLASGGRNRDIGDQLFITEETVKVHLKHVMEKLGARDRTEAVAIALRRGIIHL